MTTWVHSSQLQFTRDGSRLVVAASDGITLVEACSNGRKRIAISDVHAVAAFADQVWVVTRTGVLIRFGANGDRLDEHALALDFDGMLIPTTIGPPVALWTGRESVMLLDDLGSLAVSRGQFNVGSQLMWTPEAGFSQNHSPRAG